ncbi:50S ribosomal protein L25 [Sedimentibacter sp.]|uniref:50S ribosomal protein L25 n=1 Tax=Sedimentibacter sp. TaxID=1960295 RepID=UPI0028ADA1FD|nr:50S ribosomal protein L25 [Sedimentibacter sp.]
MQQGILNIERRAVTNSRTSKKLRNNGYIPGSISGRGKESISVAVKAEELRKGLATYGRYALFKLVMQGEKPMIGMVKDIYYSPLSRNMLNVDIQQVSLNEEIRAELPIRIKGADVLEHSKLMALRQLDTISVKGLPQDIPDEVIVDVSNVKGAENINVSNIEFPQGIVPDGNPEQIVLSIVETKRGKSSEETEEASEEELE